MIDKLIDLYINSSISFGHSFSKKIADKLNNNNRKIPLNFPS